MSENMENQEGLLPDDVLGNILCRLAPRCLAISRCVCKAWCAIIDDRRLLRAGLLPHSVGAIIINFNDLELSEFFSRPSAGPSVSGNLNYVPWTSVVNDHCNGLLLLGGYVVNPATRQWVELPPCSSSPPESFDKEYHYYLAYDPTISPHYEVFIIPVSIRFDPDIELDPTVEELEWPASLCILDVFSSRTKQWEERPFVREGEATRTIADMRSAPYCDQHHAVYWRGSLYVNCSSQFVMRISLSNKKYQVIKPPKVRNTFEEDGILYLGKSEKGVYCATNDPVQVWILDETQGQMEWVLKHIISLHVDSLESKSPWTLQDVNYYYENGDEDDKDDAIVEQKFDWDSENDDLIDPNSMTDDESPSYTTILGFHPFKEVVFLCVSLRRGLAYHLDGSKVQELGNIFPKCYGTSVGIQPYIQASFTYTPCWMGDFP